ncbi:hypothetical protein DSO57_1011389 [Entomophthora muscae]|uniref:Uncharacterized protein n=1 Tax=Entomophthora muscae TaxID=34485 RepID=A0ACC2TI61_9FUNG|nr:hypothetical protein DSO57_1011389 [Entomophthora muscae]
MGWEPNNPLLIDKVVTSPPGPKPLAVLQNSASKPLVQDAKNFIKVPTPDTSGLLGEIHKFLHESYSKPLQSPRAGTEPKEAPNTQIDKQKDSKSSHPKAASGKPPVPSATLPSETPNANPPKPSKPAQEVKHGSLLTQRLSDPSASPPATYRLPGAPYSPVHFKEYPLKPEYKVYITNNILARDLLARTTELTRYNQEGPWYVTKPCLFRDKYNFLPAYQMHMVPPVTPKLMPASAAKLLLDHTNKILGIIYITLTGVIDTIVPAASPWSRVGKSMSYLIKLAPILWWALPTQSATCQFPNASKLANQGWFPEKLVSASSYPMLIVENMVPNIELRQGRASSIVRGELKHLGLICRSVFSSLYINDAVD